MSLNKNENVVFERVKYYQYAEANAKHKGILKCKVTKALMSIIILWLPKSFALENAAQQKCGKCKVW